MGSEAVSATVKGTPLADSAGFGTHTHVRWPDVRGDGTPRRDILRLHARTSRSRKTHVKHASQPKNPRDLAPEGASWKFWAALPPLSQY